MFRSDLVSSMTSADKPRNRGKGWVPPRGLPAAFRLRVVPAARTGGGRAESLDRCGGDFGVREGPAGSQDAAELPPGLDHVPAQAHA